MDIKMLNVKRGKIWGNTQQLFCKNNVEIHRIEVKRGGYCSKHKHQSKINMFYVEEGKLEIIIFRKDANRIIEDKTVLNDGDMTYVEPGLYHMFKSPVDTIAYEIYWTEIEENDIERENVGGINGDTL